MLGSAYRFFCHMFHVAETGARTLDNAAIKAEELANIHLEIQLDEAKASALAAAQASKAAIAAAGPKTKAAIAARRSAIQASDI